MSGVFVFIASWAVCAVRVFPFARHSTRSPLLSYFWQPIDVVHQNKLLLAFARALTYFPFLPSLKKLSFYSSSIFHITMCIWINWHSHLSCWVPDSRPATDLPFLLAIILRLILSSCFNESRLLHDRIRCQLISTCRALHPRPCTFLFHAFLIGSLESSSFSLFRQPDDYSQSSHRLSTSTRSMSSKLHGILYLLIYPGTLVATVFKIWNVIWTIRLICHLSPYVVTERLTNNYAWKKLPDDHLFICFKSSSNNFT